MNTIANKFNGILLDQIADNLRVATARLDDLVASPHLADSIAALNRSLDNVDRVTVPPAMNCRKSSPPCAAWPRKPKARWARPANSSPPPPVSARWG